MNLTNPAGLLAALLVVPVIALHILRSRRTQVVVSSVIEWQAVERPVAAARPWQRLRWSWPLVLQLLAVLALAGALAGPQWNTGKLSAENVIIMIDTSASMQTTDGQPTRIADAREAALGELDSVASGASISIIDAGKPARVLASGVSVAQARRVIDGSVEAGEGGIDAGAAASLALGFDRPDTSVDYVLVSDGGIDAASLRQFPSGTRFVGVGSRSANVAVTNVIVQARGTGARVLATVENFGDDTAVGTVTVDVDGRRRFDEAIRLDGRSSREVSADVPSGKAVDVAVDVDDLLSLDNRAFGVGPDASVIDVVVIGDGDPFVDALLASIPRVEVVTVAPGEDPTAALAGADIAIVDGTAVPPSISIPFWAIAPPDGAPGVTVTGSVENPVPTLVRSDSELLADLDMRSMAVGTAQRIDAPGATTLIGAEDAPLLVSGRTNGSAFVYLAAPLKETNLPLSPEFPVLGDRIISDLARTDLGSGALRVGDVLELPVGEDVALRAPGGDAVAYRAGDPSPVLDRTGIWSIEVGGAEPKSVVVNPDPAESDIAPSDDVAIPGRSVRDAGDRVEVGRSLVVPLALLALGAMALEWFISTRRRGVSRRQWRWAAGARAAVIGCIVAALLVPTIAMSTDDPAVVFVIDSSDSMAGGADAARAAVTDAIATMPDEARAGVVVVGASALVDRTVDRDLVWRGSSVDVDGSATDLGAGLRLASALLPSDSARRVVLISDGRPTAGDAPAEAERLRRDGVRLDVIPIDSRLGSDVLVRSVDVPPTVTPGQTVAIDVIVDATTAQTAVVTLLRDDREVDSRRVELPAGSSTVSFEQPAGDPATIRWAARVGAPSNAVTANDLGRASTRVVGRTAVLVIDGGTSQTAPLVEALGATGADVRTVAATDPIGLTDLTAADVVVLSDVSVNDLGITKQTALDNAVRQLGKGLVVTGGSSSFGSGEYLGSMLEGLLPVTSEVKDPKRRSSLAQVFAVDVSGSMGACHCAEDGGGQNARPLGGVEKTEIARDAGLRALEEMQPEDEMGVLGLGDNARWFTDVVPVDDGSAQRDGLSKVRTTEESTNLEASLTASAEQLRESAATLRHIVLLTDGFVNELQLTRLAQQAGTLREEGITVSVVGTGEGSNVGLAAIATAGGGRFYEGDDLRELPDLLEEETRVVARRLMVEGEFLPTITSRDPIIDGLSSAPALSGYQATTAKPTAQVHLRIGDEEDPLLATGSAGLGRVAAWMSDGGARWAQGWSTWDGWVQHWTNVVKSVTPTQGGTVRVQQRPDGSELTAVFDEAVEAGASVTATVVDERGLSTQVPLSRVDDTTYRAPIDLAASGTYSLSATVSSGGEVRRSISGTTDVGFSREYLDDATDIDLLTSMSERTGGRGVIEPDESFDARDLLPGQTEWDLTPWLLLAAVVLVPIAVALGRLTRSRGAAAVIDSASTVVGRLGAVVTSRRRDRGERDVASTTPAPQGRAVNVEPAGSVLPDGGASPGTPTQSPPTQSPPTQSPPTATPGQPGRSPRGPTSSPTDGDDDTGTLSGALAAKRRRRAGNNNPQP